MNIKRASGGALLSLAFLFFFVYLVFGIQGYFEAFSPSNFTASVSDAVANLQTPTTAPAPEISAGAAISLKSDILGEDKILVEKSSTEKLPIASLTKLMTAIVVWDNYDLSDKAVVSKLADLQAPMKTDVKAGQVLPVYSLLEIMLIESSNKSAFALAEKMGVQKFVFEMNQKAAELGMADTSFADPMGISSQNVSTAQDLVKLAKNILKNYPLISSISREKEINIEGFGRVENTDELLGQVPEIVCGKTGFTTEAKGCLLLVMDNPADNNYFINVILGAEDRFSEMKKIIQYTSSVCQ